MSKRKKHSNIRRARAGIKGLIIEWEDKAPLFESSEFIPGKVSHKNIIYKLCAGQVWNDYGDWITTRQPFRWLIEITVVFSYPNGQEQHETRELEAYAKLCDINDHSLEKIKDAMRHGNEKYYTTTLFRVVCLDTKPKVESCETYSEKPQSSDNAKALSQEASPRLPAPGHKAKHAANASTT